MERKTGPKIKKWNPRSCGKEVRVAAVLALNKRRRGYDHAYESDSCTEDEQEVVGGVKKAASKHDIDRVVCKIGRGGVFVEVVGACSIVTLFWAK